MHPKVDQWMREGRPFQQGGYTRAQIGKLFVLVLRDWTLRIDSHASYLITHDGGAITCMRWGCGLTSWNENDVKHRYCGNCHVFHDLLSAENPGPPAPFELPLPWGRG